MAASSTGCLLFEPLSILSSLRFQLSSAAAFERRLYIGGEDGSLRVYEAKEGESSISAMLQRAVLLTPPSPPPSHPFPPLFFFYSLSDPSTAARPSFELLETVPRFGREKGAVRSLCIAPGWNALFSLSGEPLSASFHPPIFPSSSPPPLSLCPPSPQVALSACTLWMP